MAEGDVHHASVDDALSQPAPDIVPEDALADQDAEERRLGREPSLAADLGHKIPEEVLVERDQDARAEDELLWRDSEER